jgi:type IV pilus assembly protein PilQ
LKLRYSTRQIRWFVFLVFFCISARAESPLPLGPPLPAFSLASGKVLTPLSNVEFQKASLGVGRVKVTLPDAKVGMNVRRQGTNLIAEFLQAGLPNHLHRRMDVSDFATPIQSITTTQAGDRVRMVIASQGNWEYVSYQADKQWVIEIKEAKPDTKKLLPGSGYQGEKLSLHFQNIEVRSILQVIADFTQFNVITSDSVTGSLTLRLQDVPWDQALDIILQAKGLGVRKNGNVLWVAPKEEIAAKDKLDFETLASVEGVESLRTQSFQMNYAKAMDIAPQLSAGGGTPNSGARILSARGSVFAEPRTNQLFVTDTPAKLDQIQKLIAQLDIPVRQILIEARIVEASDTFGKSLGVKLGGNDLSASKGGEGGVALGGDKRLAFGSSYGNAVAATGLGGTQNLSSNFVNLPAVGQNGYGAATFALTLFSAASNHLMALEISALEADGKGKVVSSPRVITADQVKALIEQGTELPYQVASSSGATSIAFRKANLKLEVTPQITPEGSVSLDLDVTKDSVGQATAAGFAINTKHIKTQVLVENGGTVVIGGIFEVNENESETKVPFLGDLPGIGYLFKTRQRSTNKQEMLVFITPKVVSERAIVR